MNMDTTEKKLRTNYILIDYENVQPASLSIVSEYPFRVLLFVGATQNKIPIELAASMQALGKNAEYIRVDGIGKNALDFHLVLYLGRLIEKEVNGYFHIISKDSGFDTVIKHLRDQKVLVQKYAQINDILILKGSGVKTLPERVEATVDFLISRGNAKPRKIDTLSNAINAYFGRTLPSEAIDNIIGELVKRQVIVNDNGKVHYRFPESS
ncbi:PIN domain-containing protein [Methylosarcina fibrata]|uniref:PIN domain-containing protein n=1 Tax=Methylosarcina fibrata TaxID=105972 RepID=UPI0003640CAB|nr:PIN domain-containing protein [Methylosarcina fibrata]